MLINGKEINFYYSVWAHCEYMDYVVAHKDVSVARALMQKALTMNEAAIKAGMGGDRLTVEDFENLPGSAFIEIQKEIEKQEQDDCKVTVEAKSKGKKTENS